MFFSPATLRFSARACLQRMRNSFAFALRDHKAVLMTICLSPRRRRAANRVKI